MTPASDTPALDPDLAPPPAPSPARDGEAVLTALRGEIDAIDDALHDLLMRRAGVVARLAASRAKPGASPLRPGREAQILRRLLARHAGPLPAAGMVRLWREIVSISSAMQNGFAVAVFARGPEQARLARQHFGSLTPLRSHPGPAQALAAVAAGEAQVAVLPLPEEGEPAEAAWWTSLDSPRLQVVARLPFRSEGPEPGAEALAVALGAPDPSGADRSLLGIEMRGDTSAGSSRARLLEALTQAGLPPRMLLLRRDSGVLRALAELEGVVTAGDPRLAGLPVDRALPLGFYAVPLRGDENGEQA
ncbi:chorismate mutase [Siccirubricoccus sp. G192]|uniref:chorismate mutase n=1 Tax=Siccirubricoccus sp. G192 TaxID=2849651 RepID=UPI001C2BD48D|nr:chorismate mutase [Siccirubricoccus sp. G192]MBV1796235.1 chorismate mutase [Siccirubricoccus sp. G192]